jgi:hypothetical protein
MIHALLQQQHISSILDTIVLRMDLHKLYNQVIRLSPPCVFLIFTYEQRHQEQNNVIHIN